MSLAEASEARKARLIALRKRKAGEAVDENGWITLIPIQGRRKLTNLVYPMMFDQRCWTSHKESKLWPGVADIEEACPGRRGNGGYSWKPSQRSCRTDYCWGWETKSTGIGTRPWTFDRLTYIFFLNIRSWLIYRLSLGYIQYRTKATELGPQAWDGEEAVQAWKTDTRSYTHTHPSVIRRFTRGCSLLTIQYIQDNGLLPKRVNQMIWLVPWKLRSGKTPPNRSQTKKRTNLITSTVEVRSICII